MLFYKIRCRVGQCKCTKTSVDPHKSGLTSPNYVIFLIVLEVLLSLFFSMAYICPWLKPCIKKCRILSIFGEVILVFLLSLMNCRIVWFSVPKVVANRRKTVPNNIGRKAVKYSTVYDRGQPFELYHAAVHASCHHW